MDRTLSHGIRGSERAAGRLATLLLPLGAALLLGCGAGPEPTATDAGDADDAGQASAAATDAVSEAPFVWPEGAHPRATIRIAGYGEIEVELYPELAPETVTHFVLLAREGFYAGTTFHRVIPGFMIQGGDANSKDKDPRDDGQGDAGYKIADEFNAAPHERGVLSMANESRPKTAGCQFFLLHADTRHLDGLHTAFGRVVRGLDVIDAIAGVETDLYGRWGPRNRPIESVVIEQVVVTDASAVAGDSTGDASSASAETGVARDASAEAGADG